MGKWDKLKGKLPPGSPLRDKPGFEELVAGHRARVAGKTTKELIDLLAEARRRREEIDAQWTDSNAENEALGRLLIEQFDAQDFTSIRTPHGLVKTSVEPFCSVTDREALYGHVAAKPELDYMWSVNYQTLNSYAKELIEAGRDAEMPPGVSLFLKTKITITK